jgi:hypothetical protein
VFFFALFSSQSSSNRTALFKRSIL